MKIFLRYHELRYIFVSLFFAIISNIFLIGFDNVGLHYGVAIIACATLCIPCAYIAQSFFTFRVNISRIAFYRYATMQIFNLPLSFILIHITHDILQIKMLLSAPISTFIMFIWNYTSSRWALRFRQS